MLKKKKNIIDIRYIFFLILLFGNVLFFHLIRFVEKDIYSIINSSTFLTCHVILEFSGVVISSIIFVVTYYTYHKNHRLRLLIYSSTFLITAALDFVHLMSYKGMPVFFTESSVAKATTFWMISRVIFAVGLLIAGMISYNRTTTLNRIYFLAGSMAVVFGIFYIGTYHMDWIPPMFVEGHGLTPLKIGLEYFVMIVLGITTILYLRDYELSTDKAFMTFAIGLCFGIFTEAAFTLYKSVYDTYNFLGHIYKLISAYLIFRAVFIYNLDKPYLQLNEAREQIKLYAENLEKVVERRTAEIQQVNDKMIKDLEYAKRIQQSLLPPSSLNVFGVKFVSEYIPCEKLSGDFYHIHVFDSNHIGMYIADVAGHGVSAAMMTVFADRAMKPFDPYNRAFKNPSPSKMLSHFYKEFNKSDFPIEMHIVIFKAIYNVKTKVLSYCSGGMNVLPILVRKNGQSEILDKSSGFPICKFGDLYEPKFEKADVQLERGDRIIFYTDGLVENFKTNTLLKEETLIDLLQKSRDVSLETLNTRILNVIGKNADNFVNEDDITYFIMEV